MSRPFRELADATGTPESRRIANERTLDLLADWVERLQNELYAKSYGKRGVSNTIRPTLTDEEHERNCAVGGCETVCPHVRGTVTQHCSLNFTLTDAEREAVEFFTGFHTEGYGAIDRNAATLRKLLERLK
jgi:hypothetical protein